MALRTSVGTGDWSAAGTWDTGVPVNGDTFAIAAGHTVTFDVDQSGMANGMGISSIAATGSLVASTAAGSYYLKMNGDLTLNGTLQAGTSEAVPYPSTCTFTIDFNSGSNSIVMANATGNIQFFCTEPTTKYVKLTAQEPLGETVLAVDTNLTADTPWAASATIFIADSTATIDRETIAISSVAAGAITIAAPGLAAQKEVGTVVALITRNIRLINSTDFATKNGLTVSSHIDAEFNAVIAACYSIYKAEIGGSILTNTASTTYGVAYYLYNSTFDGVCCDLSSSGTHYGSSAIYNCIFADTCLISGVGTGLNIFTSSTFYGLIQSVVISVNSGLSSSIVGSTVGAQHALSNAVGCSLTGTTDNIAQRTLNTCHNFIVANTEIDGSIGAGGGVATYDLYGCTNGKFYNTVFQATSEFYGYNSSTLRSPWDYIESFDHDQVENAYKAWCLGGIVTSQTVSPPTGYTIWYELAAEDITQNYPVFRQYETTVLPGTAIEVVGQIRIADGEDLSTSGLEPQLQIIDKFADPLVDSTQSPLDYDIPADVTGAETGWQDVAVIWANQGEAPRQVIVRMIAYNDGGADTVYVDGVWAVSSYQEDITEILRRVRRLGMTSEY